MNNIINKIKDGLLLGLGFIIIVGIAQAWTGLQANKGDSLTVAKWNELVNKVETLETNIGSGSILGTKLYSYTTADRKVSTNYLNDTGKTIVVMVTGKDSGNYSYLNMRIDDSLVIRSYLDNDAHGYPNSNGTIIVPPNSTYRVSGASAYLYWHELR